MIPIPVLIQLFNVFSPIVQGIIQRHQQEHGPASMPTNEQMQAIFEANIDKYLAEGAAWTAAHPRLPVQ